MVGALPGTQSATRQARRRSLSEGPLGPPPPPASAPFLSSSRRLLRRRQQQQQLQSRPARSVSCDPRREGGRRPGRAGPGFQPARLDSAAAAAAARLLRGPRSTRRPAMPCVSRVRRRRQAEGAAAPVALLPACLPACQDNEGSGRGREAMHPPHMLRCTLAPERPDQSKCQGGSRSPMAPPPRGEME